MSDRASYRRRLNIEPLEDRRLLANVTVSNLNDVVNGNTGSIALLIATPGADGISLREAIYAANATTTADTINFSVDGTINLTNRPDPEFDHLLIEESLTINGLGSILLTIRAYDPSGAVGNGRRIFEINDGTAGLINVTINGLTMSGGDVGSGGGGGGGIWNRGENLTVNNSVISNNRTQDTGGGISSSSSGTVTINNCTLSGNTATGDGGGLYAAPATGGGVGQLILLTTNATGNSASDGAGIASSVATTIAGGTLSSNIASLRGGGVWATNTLVITGSTISGNTATSMGGGVYGNSTTVSYSSVTGNSVTGVVSSGGGLVGGGTITSSTISGNSSASVGGGVSGGFDLINSTVSGNTAAVAGGGVYRAPAESIVIRHSTITGNTAPAGAGSGIASPSSLAGNKVQVGSSIVAANTNSDIDRLNGVQATIESLGFNLVGSGSGIAAFSAASGDKIGLNPMLGSLANNGGSTLTHALLPGSPAIDAGNPSAVAGVGTVPQYDQRGAPNNRVKGARIDIGAFESVPVVPSQLGDYNRDSAVNAADYVFWRKFQGTTGLVAYAGADGSGNGTIDPADRTVWRENFGETGGGGAASAAVADQALTDDAGASGPALDPRLGETRLHVVESLRDSNRSISVAANVASSPSTARSLVGMVWLNLPVESESRSVEEDAWLNTASLGEADAETDVIALDVAFESLAAL